MKTLIELHDELMVINDEIQILSEQKKKINSEILEAYKDQIESSLKAKEEPFGVVNFEDDDVKLSVTIPKKVDWDQDKLAGLYEAIRKGNENPLDYMTIDYGVPETKYKSWPQVIKDEFISARTVKPGSPSIKLTVKETN